MASTTDSRVASVRAFNRFYTRRIGLLGSQPLPQARVLFELGQRPTTAVADLRRVLDLDAGYLSRLLAGLEADGLVVRRRSAADARRHEVSLTAAGVAKYADLDARSAADIRALLHTLSDDDQRRVLAAMHTVEDALDGAAGPRGVTVREPRPGDLGWAVQRHGALYAEEYGWDETFEALVARIVADFAEHRDPARERAWIAEVAGERVGCVFCTRQDDAVAKLRLLLVEPDARGMGVGARLVDECLRFARRAGYEAITLWTNDVLHAARRIYERAGFVLEDSEAHHSFGHDLVSQTWSRDL
jgi:DNA-binding MarR family transcriptional regulator/N-acetylglutamate synthase-like GNAT family acetyltransferase